MKQSVKVYYIVLSRQKLPRKCTEQAKSTYVLLRLLRIVVKWWTKESNQSSIFVNFLNLDLSIYYWHRRFWSVDLCVLLSMLSLKFRINLILSMHLISVHNTFAGINWLKNLKHRDQIAFQRSIIQIPHSRWWFNSCIFYCSQPGVIGKNLTSNLNFIWSLEDFIKVGEFSLA